MGEKFLLKFQYFSWNMLQKNRRFKVDTFGDYLLQTRSPLMNSTASFPHSSTTATPQQTPSPTQFRLSAGRWWMGRTPMNTAVEKGTLFLNSKREIYGLTFILPFMFGCWENQRNEISLLRSAVNCEWMTSWSGFLFNFFFILCLRGANFASTSASM